jgi:hypothetical protein
MGLIRKIIVQEIVRVVGQNKGVSKLIKPILWVI